MLRRVSGQRSRVGGTGGVERAKNILLFPTRERNWAVAEEASGKHFAHYGSYEEAEEFARSLAQSRRVQLLVLDLQGVSARHDFRPWWRRLLFRE